MITGYGSTGSTRWCCRSRRRRSPSSLLIGGAAVLTVIFTTRAGLAVHHAVVEVLHLIGARDGYIARQFQRQALRLALRGGIVGLVLTLATLLRPRPCRRRDRALRRARPPAAVAARCSPGTGCALLLLPSPLRSSAMVTARLTVLRALERMP